MAKEITSFMIEVLLCTAPIFPVHQTLLSKSLYRSAESLTLHYSVTFKRWTTDSLISEDLCAGGGRKTIRDLKGKKRRMK